MLTRECWQSRDGVGLWDTLGLSVQTTVSHHTLKQTQDVNQEWHCEGEGFWQNFNYNYNSKFEVKGGCSWDLKYQISRGTAVQFHSNHILLYILHILLPFIFAKKKYLLGDIYLRRDKTIPVEKSFPSLSVYMLLLAGVQQALLPHRDPGRAAEESQSGEEPQDGQDQEAQHPGSDQDTFRNWIILTVNNHNLWSSTIICVKSPSTHKS